MQKEGSSPYSLLRNQRKIIKISRPPLKGNSLPILAVLFPLWHLILGPCPPWLPHKTVFLPNTRGNLAYQHVAPPAVRLSRTARERTPVGCSGIYSRKLGATSCYMGSVVGHVTGHVMTNANTPARAANSRSS